MQLCAPALSVQSEITKRIVNGSPAPDGKVPWAGQIKVINRNSNLYNCGVTVISTQWLLTAAHCIYYKKDFQNTDLWHIQLGSTNVEANGCPQLKRTSVAFSLDPDIQNENKLWTSAAHSAINPTFFPRKASKGE
ncbi:hypothetical protein EG68_09271 [Paragonimus skrjabini miyazakii]|uniref:Peptidase S1 domain-containing protein n=1 Tax=Paragonimus skrjabini miyazakii TaxID=59628 RepID=A0A8S9YNG5_9TREM|nr:hypothetical protein EG68_09271 [Paragonimus skrjabini miyazakii]